MNYFSTMNLKRVAFAVICCLMVFGTYEAQAQLQKAKKAAKQGYHTRSLRLVSGGMIKKIKKSEALLFVKEYPLAMEQIENEKTKYSKEQFGYDELADRSKYWIEMYDNMAQLPSEIVDKKGNKVTIEIIDYRPIRAEYIAQACEAHYLKMVELIAAPSFAEKEVAVEHADIIIKINEDKPYKDESELIVSVYVTEADNVLTNGADYKAKAISIKHFTIAEKYGYKDSWRTKVGDMYYQEATALMSSEKFDDKKTAIKLYIKAEEFNPAHNDWQPIAAEAYYAEGVRYLAISKTFQDKKNSLTFLEKALTYQGNYKDISEICANVYYEEGIHLESVPSFENMALAASCFEKALQYQEGYKDAELKKIECEKRSYVNLIFVNASGNPYPKSSTAIDMKYLPRKLPKYIRLGEYNGGEDLNIVGNYDNFANDEYIFVKLGSNVIYDYEHIPARTTSRDIVKYYKYEQLPGKPMTKEEITKSSYNTIRLFGKKELDRQGITLKKFSGILTETVETAKLSVNYSIEVWDSRNGVTKIMRFPRSFQLGSKKKVNEVYTGDPSLKPSNLKNDQNTIPNREQMIAQYVTGTMSLAKVLPKFEKPTYGKPAENSMETFVKKLSSVVKFK